MKYFKVKLGYGKDDFGIIDETEVEKVISAISTGKMAVLKEGIISGNHIISVLPFFNIEMGWNLDYQPTGEDYVLIGNKRRQEYADFLSQITNNNYKQIK